MRDVICPCNDAGFASATITYTGTAGVTATFKPGPPSVLVWTTTDAYVLVGEGVTATSAATPIPAYTPMKFDVPPGTGASWRVSAIQISAGGSVYAKPLNG